MSTLIARLKRRSTYSPSPSRHSRNNAPPATPIRYPMPGAWSEMSPLERKIHPDLNSLIIEDTTPISPISPIPSVAQDDTASNLGFVPLPPSTRKRSASLRIQDSGNVIERNRAIEQVSQDVSGRADNTMQSSSVDDQDISDTPTSTFPEAASPLVNASFPNTSGETFGRTEKITSPHGQGPSYVGSDIQPTTPVTPDSSGSRDGNGETCAHTPNLSSAGFRSNLSHKLESTTSSPHTFGIPTPPSSGFIFSPRRRRIHASSETLPPLPPLDHPAFQSTSISNNVNNSQAMRIFTTPGLLLKKDDQQSKPRHALSLPSMSRSRTKSPKHSRERARTQSRIKTQEIFLSTPPLHSTPRRSFRHSRTQSKDSTTSSRRASAEFSTVQATLIGDGNGTTGSWEAQVSREMVRMSLGKKPRPGSQNNAGMAESVQAQSTSNNSIKTSALGSPFFLQYTHNSSGTTPNMRSNLVTSGNKGESDIPTMSRDTTAGPAFGQVSKSIERSGTPSPPPGPAAPSTSHLMLPSLSFTAPTPDASPVTPIKRTGHQEAATETPQSVLKPNIAPIGRSANTGHKGKRKADEADAEGGNTPKDQPRATFAEPRPHRASGNSGSSRATNSGSSRAPSSYHRKRARLSTTPESRPGSRASVDVQNATNTGSWSSKASSRHPPQPPRPSPGQQSHREPSRRSISSVSIHGSIPISALISPHAPSIQGSSVFHMRDPRKPRPIQPTPWSLSMPLSGDGSWLERGGSPLHAWLFFVGFLIFPIWWVAVFVGIPRTRRLGGNEVEKGVVLDDPQLEFDANSWRKRCRIMAVVSFFTYIPFVILVAIFVR